MRWPSGAATGMVMILMVAGCAVHRGMTDAQRAVFTRGTVALMTEPDRASADRLAEAMRQGKPLPPAAEIIPITRLDTLSAALSLAAARLQECEVSPPVPPWETTGYTEYVILQRGGEPGSPCRGGERPRSLAAMYHEFEEKAGEVFIGLLAVGLVGLSIALPFILLN